MQITRPGAGAERLIAAAVALKRLLIVWLWLAVVAMANTASKPVKVFILAGQSNMQGQGIVSTMAEMHVERPGTPASMLKDPAKAPLLKNWVYAQGEWAEGRDDVWVWDVNEFGHRHCRLEFGYGWNLGSRMWFGPEMQFGHLLGNHFDNQVLIIKTAWGGRDLYKDFRPPSSGGTVGPFYTQMLALLSSQRAKGASYQTNTVEGWCVLVNERLLTEDKAATKNALGLLRLQLQQIVRGVPGPAVAALREVTL